MMEFSAFYGGFILYTSTVAKYLPGEFGSPQRYLLLSVSLVPIIAFTWIRSCRLSSKQETSEGSLETTGIKTGTPLGVSGRILPRPYDWLSGLTLGMALLAIASIPVAILTVFGTTNPLWNSFKVSSVPLLILLPSTAISGIMAGYAEELVFRFHLPALLSLSGLSRRMAGGIAVVLFASAHGSQGWPGIITAGFLGLLLQYKQMKGCTIHTLAIGHGTYNFCILLFAMILAE